MADVLVVRDVTRGTIVAARVEVGASLWAKFMGLMGRPALPAGAGLWLPDSNGIHMMFMRFPIDAVFLGAPRGGASDGSDGSGASEVRPVLSVHRALRPWTGLVPFVRGAKGVLELPVGAVDAAGVATGDLVELAPAVD